jgi:hypothetical protein
MVKYMEKIPYYDANSRSVSQHIFRFVRKSVTYGIQVSLLHYPVISSDVRWKIFHITFSHTENFPQYFTENFPFLKIIT